MTIEEAIIYFKNRKRIIGLDDKVQEAEDITIEVLVLLAEYIKKHPLVVECVGEYIMQSDEAQVDAIELVCNIFDNI